jgi:hypothetical protein
MIVLITPTGDREVQFKICSELMKDQTYMGKVVWIIIDDVLPITTDSVTGDFREGWDIVKLYPTPKWGIGDNTQGRNLMAGISFINDSLPLEDIEGIFIIEDDDFYKPIFLERMVLRLKDYDLVGERNTVYYNIPYRSYSINPNIRHSSLFQTAFTPKVIPFFIQCLGEKFIDILLWTYNGKKLLFKENNLSVGIKGLPGRPGIGAGHRRGGVMDFDLSFLKGLLGVTSKYLDILNPLISQFNPKDLSPTTSGPRISIKQGSRSVNTQGVIKSGSIKSGNVSFPRILER